MVSCVCGRSTNLAGEFGFRLSPGKSAFEPRCIRERSHGGDILGVPGKSAAHVRTCMLAWTWLSTLSQRCVKPQVSRTSACLRKTGRMLMRPLGHVHAVCTNTRAYAMLLNKACTQQLQHDSVDLACMRMSTNDAVTEGNSAAHM